MLRESAGFIFQMGNFFDELCITDQNAVIRYYQACSANGASFSVDQAVGRKITDVFSALNPESNEILLALEERKAICTFHEYCLNYKGEAYPGYVSVFPIHRKKEFAGLAIALKYLTADYQKEFIQIRDNSYRRKRYNDEYTIDDIITCDPNMERLKDKLRKVSKKDSTVLIRGPFISQNCSAIPENLLESTLFGTEKGSFTGAITNQGLLETADGGTLFLDEINSMSMSLQSKILTAIENKSVRHLGGHEDIRTNVRIIAAINEDPFKAIEEHRLRSDLFYRLNVVSLHLPDLKDRPADIPFLAEYYIRYFNDLFDMNIRGLSPEANRVLCCHTWPGNVRELRNVIEGAFNIVETEWICREDLPEYLQTFTAEKRRNEELMEPKTYIQFQACLQQLEEEFLQRTVERSRTKAEAAKFLGISPQALNYKLHKQEKEE